MGRGESWRMRTEDGGGLVREGPGVSGVCGGLWCSEETILAETESQ